MTAECDRVALSRLAIGSYVEIACADGGNGARGSHQVQFTLDGLTVGYVPIRDQIPYAASLKLGRRMYGVITNIRANGSETVYEVETWYAKN